MKDAAAAAAPAKSGRLTKKHVLIASISVIITALIVTAVLVGIHLFMRNNVETLKVWFSSPCYKHLRAPATNDRLPDIEENALDGLHDCALARLYNWLRP